LKNLVLDESDYGLSFKFDLKIKFLTRSHLKTIGFLLHDTVYLALCRYYELLVNDGILDVLPAHFSL
jgi:hypothetical protein